jgi:hypothetical protein
LSRVGGIAWAAQYGGRGWLQSRVRRVSLRSSLSRRQRAVACPSAEQHPAEAPWTRGNVASGTQPFSSRNPHSGLLCHPPRGAPRR